MTVLLDTEIKAALQRARTIAVVGLSDRPERPSHEVARFLQRSGYRVLPVNPNLRGPLLGERPYRNLRQIEEHVDIVDVFRRSEFVAGVVEDAIAIGADVIWTQIGVVDEAAARRAEQAGMGVVMDRCIAVAYRMLM
jgi:uncharacterized protein